MRIFLKKSILLGLLYLAIAAPVFCQQSQWATQENPYTLVWQDEFDGPGIDRSNWTYDLGSHGWGNNEWQLYTDRPENAYIEDGYLVIEARKESYNGSEYTSARMKTKGLKAFKYGRADIRAKLPIGQGIWPALWMLGANISEVNWPKCGEIDIMELVGHEPSTTHGTYHWDDKGHQYIGGKISLPFGTFSDDFHIFSIIWDEQKIQWLLDGTPFYTGDISAPEFSEFHLPFFFLFNVAVGGNWPGYPDETTTFPKRMYVDYIRFYQAK